MRIGELAREAGFTTKTIRYYESVGVMSVPPRTAAGYRDYGADAARRLAFVRAAQSIGLSLGEIREVIAFRDRGETPCPYVTSLIQRHAAELGQRIEELERMRRDLVRLAGRARAEPGKERADAAAVCHVIEGSRQGPGESQDGPA